MVNPAHGSEHLEQDFYTLNKISQRKTSENDQLMKFV